MKDNQSTERKSEYRYISKNTVGDTPGDQKRKNVKKSAVTFGEAFRPEGSIDNRKEDIFVGVVMVIGETNRNVAALTYYARSPSCKIFDCKGEYCLQLEKDGFIEKSGASGNNHQKIKSKTSSHQ